MERDEHLLHVALKRNRQKNLCGNIIRYKHFQNVYKQILMAFQMGNAASVKGTINKDEILYYSQLHCSPNTYTSRNILKHRKMYNELKNNLL